MKVQGTVAMENAVSQHMQRNPHLTETEAKHEIAQESVKQRKDSLNKVYKDVNSSVSSIQKELDLLTKDENGKTKLLNLDPNTQTSKEKETVARYNELNQRMAEANQSRSMVEDNLSKLFTVDNKKHTATDSTDIDKTNIDKEYDDILSQGASYWGMQYLRSSIQNWADSYAMTHYKEDIKPDQGGIAMMNNQTKVKEMELQSVHWQAELDNQWKIAQSNNQTKENLADAKAGNGKSTGSGTGAYSGVGGDPFVHYEGNDPTTVEHIEDYAKEANKQFATEYSQAMSIAGNAIPGLVSAIGMTDSNGKPMDSVFLRDVQEGFEKYLQDGTYTDAFRDFVTDLKKSDPSVSFKYPSTIVDSLISKGSKYMKDHKDANNALTNQSLFSQLQTLSSVSKSILSTTRAKEDFDTKLTSEINDPKWNKITYTDKKGNRKLMDADFISKAFPSQQKLKTEFGSFSVKELAQKFIEGNLEVTTTQVLAPKGIGLHDSSTSIPEFVFNTSEGKKTVMLSDQFGMELHNLFTTMENTGKGADIYKRFNESSSRTAYQTLQNDGRLGKQFTFLPNKKDPNNGFGVIANAVISNPSENISEIKDKNGKILEDADGKTARNFISGLSQEDINSISTHTLNGTTRELTLHVKPSVLAKKENKKAADVLSANGVIRLQLNPNTTGDILGTLPGGLTSPLSYSLKKDGYIKSTAADEAMGVRYTIMADNKANPTSFYITDLYLNQYQDDGSYHWVKQPDTQPVSLSNSTIEDYIGSTMNTAIDNLTQANNQYLLYLRNLQKNNPRIVLKPLSELDK